MFTELARCLLFSFALLPSTAWAAEPTKLKLSFFSSDTAVLYGGGVKPFVDAINSEAKGLLEIEVFFRGALGKPAQQPQLVRDGVADIASARLHRRSVSGQCGYRVARLVSRPT